VADIRPFVLAAGFGTRLRPLTDQLPKPVVPVLGQPLVGLTLARLERAGHGRVVLNAHHQPDRLRTEVDAWRDRFHPALELDYSVELPEILGTGGGLVAARPLLGDGVAALINGDILCDFDLPSLAAAHEASGAAATILLVEHPEVERFGAITTDAEGRVLDLAGLGQRLDHAAGGPGGEPVRRGVFAGVHLAGPAIFDHLPGEGFACIVRQGYVPLLAAGEDVRAVFHDGTWNDLGTVERYLDTHTALLRSGFPDACELADASAVAWGLDARGRAYGRADRVEVADAAVLRGPIALGEGCVVGAGAVVGPDCHLGAGVMVGERCALQRVVAWPGARLPAASAFAAVALFMARGELRAALP
jgi:mannose-1-phosphate guanylyltransferase